MSFAEPLLDAAEEREQDDKRSIIASGIALLTLIFALVLLPGNWLASPFQAFLFGAGLCVAIWVAAWFAALRHGSNWMALIAFIMLLFVGLGGTTFKFLREAAGANYDSSRARHKMLDTLYSQPGKVTVVSDVGGPTMAITGRYLNRILADRNAYAKGGEEAEMQMLIEYPQLLRGEDVLQDCKRFTDLSAIAAKTKAGAHAHAKAARTEIEASELNRTARGEMLAEFNAVQKIFLPMQDRLWDVRSELAKQLGASCTILARGRWQDRGQLMFTDNGDYQAFGGVAKKINTLLAEEVDIQNAALRQTVDRLNAM